MTIEREEEHLGLRDVLLLAAFCVVLFGSALLTFRPLSAREADFTREPVSIAADGNEPHLHRWATRPPLQRWTIERIPGAGKHDRFVTERLASIVAGTLVVLLTTWMAGRWFDRRTGLMSGYVLATTWSFFVTSSRATEAMVLLVTLAMFIFARCEWFNDQRSYATRTNPFGTRAWPIVGLFVLIGATHFDGPPLVEPLIILSTLAAFLVWNLDARRLLRYAWVWGWLAMIGVGIVWPSIVLLRYPDVAGVWKANLVGPERTPVWFYLWALILCTLPWLPAMVGGFRETWLRAQIPGVPARLVICLAIVPVVILSLLSRKEFGYFLPLTPAWAIVFAFGLQRLWTLVKARFPDASGVVAFRNLVIFVAIIEISLQFFIR